RPLLGDCERHHEHRISARGDPVAAGFRPRHRSHGQLAAAICRIGGAAPRGRRAGVHDASGTGVRRGRYGRFATLKGWRYIAPLVFLPLLPLLPLLPFLPFLPFPPYLPVHFGFRFARNDATPSLT